MNLIKHIYIDARLTANIVWHYVLKTDLLIRAIALFVSILFVLQWLFNLEQLSYVLGSNSGLSIADKIEFLIDAFLNIFKLFDALVPLSMILIAFFQAAAITLILELRKSSKKNATTAQMSSLSLGIIGSGCVACGGSIITPLLGAVASNISITLAERIGDALLVIAVLLSYWALSRIALVYAHKIAQKG